MNAMCRSCLCVVVVIGCISFAVAEEKPGPKRSEYDRFIQPYTAKVESGWFPGPKGGFDRVEVPLKLIVTAIVDDEPRAHAREPDFSRECRFGCQVASDGRVYHFSYEPFASKGGGYPTIPDADRKRLDKLLLKLPDDGARLPPFDRRVVLQVPEGDHSRARVYDRANAPDEVLEILRLTESGIGPWVPEFKPESTVRLHDFQHGLHTVLTPAGLLVSVASNTPFIVVDPTAHKLLKEIPVPDTSATPVRWYSPDDLKLSPDGSLAAVISFVNCWVFDTRTWQPVRRIAGGIPGKAGYCFSSPRFTADGRSLLLRRYDYDDKITTLVAYDTTTWESRGKLAGMPDGVRDYVESRTGKHAVILLKNRELEVRALWNPAGHRYAKLAERVESYKVAFSPDESMVAIATERQHDEGYWPSYRVRVWKTDTGQLVNELYPSHLATCNAVDGLQWTADAKFVFAATRAVSPDDYAIDVWGAGSGRLRGTLNTGVCMPLGVVVVLPDGRQLAVSGSDSSGLVIRFWDLAAALKQIRAFEDSLAAPKAGK